MLYINDNDNLLQIKTSTNFYLPTLWIICGIELYHLWAHVFAYDGHGSVIRSSRHSGFPIITFYDYNAIDEKLGIQVKCVANRFNQY